MKIRALVRFWCGQERRHIEPGEVVDVRAYSGLYLVRRRAAELVADPPAPAPEPEPAGEPGPSRQADMRPSRRKVRKAPEVEE